MIILSFCCCLLLLMCSCGKLYLFNLPKYAVIIKIGMFNQLKLLQSHFSLLYVALVHKLGSKSCGFFVKQIQRNKRSLLVNLYTVIYFQSSSSAFGINVEHTCRKNRRLIWVLNLRVENSLKFEYCAWPQTPYQENKRIFF